jgi:hypothetical protein
LPAGVFHVVFEKICVKTIITPLAWEATDGFNFDLSKAPVLKNSILTLSANAQRDSGAGQVVWMVWISSEAPDGNVWIVETTAKTVRPLAGGAASGLAAVLRWSKKSTGNSPA